MGMLGIRNRTEDWKTVEHFSNLNGDAKVRLAKALGESGEISAQDIQIELFWYGMRDFVYKLGKQNKVLPIQHLKERYCCLFPELRERVNGVSKFRKMEDDNYIASTTDQMKKLYSNLVHTEIDIVIETPNRFFIGEAKHEMKAKFGSKGGWVLRHQLIRQYVMAKIFVDLVSSSDSGLERKVAPFIVGDRASLSSIMNTGQVEFMLKEGWLKKQNILSWDCIKKIAESAPTAS